MLAIAFFTTSISLTLLARHSAQPGSVFDTVKPTAGAPAAPADGQKAPETGGGILDKIQPPAAPAPAPGQVPGGQ